MGGWLTGIVTAAIIVMLAEMVMPEGNLSQSVSKVASIMFMAAVIIPLSELII